MRDLSFGVNTDFRMVLECEGFGGLFGRKEGRIDCNECDSSFSRGE